MVLEEGEIRLDIRPVSSLLPHEETIPEQLGKISARIKADGLQKDPLMVDGETGVVLDGMHRLSAFEHLGLDKIVCCLVDYSSPGIELRNWTRVYKTPAPSLVAEALEELDLTRKVDTTEAFQLLESRRSALVAFRRGACLIPERPGGLRDAFRMVRAMDALAKSLGWQRTFVMEDEIDVALQEENNIVVQLQRITKQDVIDAARSRNLFPCKTSMHTIDPRPVALDFPLSELKGATRRSIQELMKNRLPRTLPPNSVYEGRRYKERLLVLDPR